MAPNDEVERRAVAPTLIEAALSQSSTPSLAHRRLSPRDRSNRWLDSCADAVSINTAIFPSRRSTAPLRQYPNPGTPHPRVPYDSQRRSLSLCGCRRDQMTTWSRVEVTPIARHPELRDTCHRRCQEAKLQRRDLDERHRQAEIVMTSCYESNDEVERRRDAPPPIEAGLSQSSTPSWATEDATTCDRSNRQLEACARYCVTRT